MGEVQSGRGVAGVEQIEPGAHAPSGKLRRLGGGGAAASTPGGKEADDQHPVGEATQQIRHSHRTNLVMLRH